MAPPKSKSTTSKRTGTSTGTGPRSNGAESLLLCKEWRVGRLLGHGAQASVHALIDTRTGTHEESHDFVVKVAALPETLAPPKRKKSLLEINADALNGEFHCYNAPLRCIQGVHIPRLPLLGLDTKTSPYPPVRGEIVVDGKAKFRYLVIEKMDAPYFALVDRLMSAHAKTASSSTVASKKKSNSTTTTTTTTPMVSLGPIFVSMIETVKAVHAGGQLLVDVKADNWMLKDKATGGAASKAPSTFASFDAAVQHLATTIRCLDLAICRPYLDYTRVHRPDVVGDGVAEGTPLYASVHVHAGHTASRRDDLYSVGVIIGELLIRLQAHWQGTDHLYRPSVAGAEPSYLPWATEKSEQAMRESMKANFTNKTSEFYRRMPTTAAPILHAYLERVHAVEYDKKPPYAALIEMVQYLPVPWGGSSATAAAPRRASGDSDKSSAKPPPSKKRRGAATTTVPVAAAAAAAAASLKPPPKTQAKVAAVAAATSAERASANDPPTSSSRARTTRTARSARSEAVGASAVADATAPIDDELTAKAVAAVAARRRGAKRSAGGSTRSPPGGEDTKVGRTSRATAAATAAKSGDAAFAASEDDDGMEVEESFCTAQTSHDDNDDDFEPMEVDKNDDDDDVEIMMVVPAAAAPKKAKSSSAATLGLEVTFTEGTLAGKSYRLADGPGQLRCLVVGSNPTRTVGKTTASVAVPDGALAPSHAKLSLLVMKSGTRTIQVQNLSTNRGSSLPVDALRVDGQPVQNKVHAFPGSLIRIGSTVLSVSAFDGPGDTSSTGKENAVLRTAAAARSTKSSSSSRKL